jgi:hypothetical protein
MDRNRRFDDAVSTWLEATAPSALPRHVLDTTFERTRGTRQQVGWQAPSWRPSRLRQLPALGGVAVMLATIVLVAGLIGLMGSPPPEPSPTSDPSPTPIQTSGGMWPQASLAEVRQAQALADAGEPSVMWQVTGVIELQLAQHHPKDAPIFLRFLEDRLGWENYRWDEAFAHPDGLVDGDVVYVRCADGKAVDRYRIPDPRLRGCAPTSDDGRHETVKINIAQLDRKGPGGIWVVTNWEITEPATEAGAPSDAELQASLGAFLQARIDGEGAEAFVDVSEYAFLAEDWVEPTVPLLYATSSGKPYERSAYDVVDGPAWPTGTMQVEARLFADGDKTVVEQRFLLERDETGLLRVVYRFEPGTEDGRSVRVTYGFLDGVVTYRTDLPLAPSQDGFRAPDRLAVDGLLPNDDAPRRVAVFLADPRAIGPDCTEGAASGDAATLAARIGANPTFDAAVPAAITVGGIPALQMDVVLGQEAGRCSAPLLTDAAFHVGADRARITLLDLPPGSNARVLAIVTITDEDSFETVTSYAARIVGSIEIHAP